MRDSEHSLFRGSSRAIGGRFPCGVHSMPLSVPSLIRPQAFQAIVLALVRQRDLSVEHAAPPAAEVLDHFATFRFPRRRIFTTSASARIGLNAHLTVRQPGAGQRRGGFGLLCGHSCPHFKHLLICMPISAIPPTIRCWPPRFVHPGNAAPRTHSPRWPGSRSERLASSHHRHLQNLL